MRESQEDMIQNAPDQADIRRFEHNPGPHDILRIEDEDMLFAVMAGAVESLNQHKVGDPSFTEEVRDAGFILLVSNDGITETIHVVNITETLVWILFTIMQIMSI